MMIIVGLGNPGEKFKLTRHNAGFMALDAFAGQHDFPDFILQKKYDSLTAESEGILLVKPQTFMNESGAAVKKIIRHNPFSPASFIVVHDDIDLVLGKIKIVKNSGSAGHKGIESIIQHLGTQNFIRIKIGICPEKGKPANVETFVIKKFTAQEKELLDDSMIKVVKALDLFLKDGLEKAMNEYNT